MEADIRIRMQLQRSSRASGSLGELIPALKAVAYMGRNNRADNPCWSSMIGNDTIINLKLVGYFTITFFATAYEPPQIKALRYNTKQERSAYKAETSIARFKQQIGFKTHKMGKEFHMDIW